MSNKKSLGFVLLILGFALIALTGIRTISNPDIFTHIALGQAGNVKADTLSYTMTDTQWINMHPLYNKLVYSLWSMGGAGLVTFVHVLAVLAAFGLIFRLGKEWGGPLSQSLALLLCAHLLFPVFNPGPYAFFMLFTALFVTLLHRVKNFPMLAAFLIILQIAWTNMHPSFLFGPLLILLFTIENWQNTRNTSRVSLVTPLTTRLLALSGITLLATLANPNLINLHRHLIENWKLLSGTETLEWISLFGSFFPQQFITSLTIFTLLLGAGGLITLQKRLPLMTTALALTGAFCTVRSIGSLHVFAFMAFPFLTLSFNAVSEYLSRTLTTVLKTSNERLHKILSIIALVLLLVSIGSLVSNQSYARIGSASTFGLGLADDAFPVAAATTVLNRPDFPAKILNVPHDGGYLALTNPQKKIFCDTRSTFYGKDFYTSLSEGLRGQPEQWKKIMTDWTPHAVVMNGCWQDTGALANRLIASRAWKLTYFDGATVILVRDLPEYASLIKDPSIQKAGVDLLEKSRQSYIEDNKGLIKAGNPSRLIGAGALYLALNRPQEAQTMYEALTENNPTMAGAWLGLGQSFVLQKQLSKGLEYMEKAVKITPRDGRTWIYLYQAYGMKGDKEKADFAVTQLNKFFKAEKSTVEQQEVADPKSKDKKPAGNANQKTNSPLRVPADLK